MGSRWKPTRTRGGGVVPSGLDPHPPDAPRPMKPQLGLYRAVVVNTYVTDDDDNRSRSAVECDVVLVRGNVPLPRVAVAQNAHGVNDAHGLWIPRPSTRNAATGEPLALAHSGAPGTPLGDLDGDMVVVEFIEGDPHLPLITRALSHYATRRLVTGAVDDADASLGWKEGDDRRGSPRRNEHYFRHAGTEVRVNGQGDLLIDTVGATDDLVNEDASGATGQVRIRVKSSQHFTVEMDGADVLEVWKDGAQVRIDLGEGANQRLILGDAFRDFINSFLSNKFDKHTHEAGAFSAPAGGGNVTGISGPPTSAASVPPVPLTHYFTGTQMGEDLLSDLSRTKKT